MSAQRLDCVTIGYYEPEFGEYERIIRQLGEDSEAYRDLKFSFVDLGGRKLTYAGLLSEAYRRADGRADAEDEFKSGDIPNLAAVYLTSYLRRRGFRARYINLFLYEKEKLQSYMAEDPLCVAITTTFYSLNFPAIEIVRGIREHNQETCIVVGGPLVANHVRRYPPDELLIALDDIGADVYVIDSQGEHTLALIVQCLREGGDLSRVPNIIYRTAAGRLEQTPATPEDNSLDENYIDWGLFGDEPLGPTLQTRTARSCAFNCSFCAYPTRAGKLTLAHLDTLERELDSMRDIGGVKNVVFIDDTFNVPLPRFKDICRLMIRKNYNFNWFSYFRCSNSDGEAVELMARSGCKGVFLGIESGSPAILKNMNKHAATEQYRQGIGLLRQHGIMTFGSFITGFPGETAETVQETIDFIRETKVDFYRSQIWYCEPGTPIYDQKEKFGIDGEGFNWEHATMDSLEAMDHIDRMFLTIEESSWLPQWSFDFWIIPYVLGKGLPLDRFKSLVASSNRMLKLEIASMAPHEKATLQKQEMSKMVSDFQGWQPA
jgi:radical SAM PhpK family P-methyltransferase